MRARRRVRGCADAGAGLSGGVRSLGPLAGPVVRRGRAAGLRRAAPGSRVAAPALGPRGVHAPAGPGRRRRGAARK